MKPQDLNPPAIIRQHVNLAAMERTLAGFAAQYRRSSRLTIEAAVEYGRYLSQMRPLYQDGAWGKLLEKVHISSSNASRLMRMGTLTDEEIESVETQTDALELVEKKKDVSTPNPDLSRDSDNAGSSNPVTEDTNESADPPQETKPPPLAETSQFSAVSPLCNPCQAIGYQRPNCKACSDRQKDMRAKGLLPPLAGATPTSPPPPPPPVAPKPAKNGAEIPTPKQLIDELGKVNNHLDAYSSYYRLQQTIPRRAVVDLMEALRGNILDLEKLAAKRQPRE